MQHRRGAVEIEVRASAAEGLLVVRDQGVGMPAEAIPKLFERY
jgi:signal transduction histidine kinase